MTITITQQLRLVNPDGVTMTLPPGEYRVTCLPDNPGWYYAIAHPGFGNWGWKWRMRMAVDVAVKTVVVAA